MACLLLGGGREGGGGGGGCIIAIAIVNLYLCVQIVAIFTLINTCSNLIATLQLKLLMGDMGAMVGTSGGSSIF